MNTECSPKSGSGSCPPVTIGIMVMDQLQVTQECLHSLTMTDYEAYDVIVVSNDSGPNVLNMLIEFQRFARGKGIACKLIINGANVGAASGRNQILRLAQTPYVAFLDNDTVTVSPMWLRILVQCLETEPDAAIAGAKLLFHDRPRVIQAAGGGVSQSGRVCDIGRNMPHDAPAFNRRRSVQFLTSACMLLRTSVYEECGGFDTAFDPVLFEEIDFCYRVRSKGYRLLYVPEAEMLHRENQTTFGDARVKGRYQFIKHGRLFKKRWCHVFEQEDGPTDKEVRAFNAGRAGRSLNESSACRD